MTLYYKDIDNTDISKAISRLEYLVDTIPPLLLQISDDEFINKPSPEAWSKKEIMGHLIDSATNNHQRFIRIQYENKPVIGYDQNKWNALSGYNSLHSKHVIDFWAMYNKHMIYIIKQIPALNLKLTGIVPGNTEMPLAWYINDYVEHLEHHLSDVVKY